MIPTIVIFISVKLLTFTIGLYWVICYPDTDQDLYEMIRIPI